MSIGKTLVTVILAAHLLSCFWFWVHCYDALQEVSKGFDLETLLVFRSRIASTD